MHTPTTEALKPEAANPAPHASREEMDQRLGIMRLWRVEGMSRQEIKAQTMALWKVCPRTAQLYLRKVEASLTRHANRGDELMNLQLSQLMRDRLLQELNHRMLGSFKLETKEVIQLANAVRTLLDARDRTVRAMHLLRSEAPAVGAATEGEPKRDADLLRDGEPSGVSPRVEAREPAGVADLLRESAASSDQPAGPQGDAALPGSRKMLRAADAPPGVFEHPDVDPEGHADPVDREAFLKALQMVDEAESILRGRSSAARRQRPSEDPLGRLLRDAQATDTLPAAVPPTPKSNPGKEMPASRAGRRT